MDAAVFIFNFKFPARPVSVIITVKRQLSIFNFSRVENEK